MRLTTIIILVTFMQVSATTFAQKVTLEYTNMSLKRIFKELKSQTGYNFLYTERQMANAKPVSIKVKDRGLSDVLAQIFTDQPLSYQMDNKTVVIRDRPVAGPASASDAPVSGQAVIKGRVTNERGEPLANVSVRVKGNQQAGTSTAADGTFMIRNLSPTSTLVLSSVGYEQLTVQLASMSATQLEQLQLVMKHSNSQLEEVIVIGYGTTTRQRIVGAVDQIGSKTFQDRPVGNVTQALQGASPSLTIQQKSMDPNDNSMNINIRGISTVNSNAPLVVIDGIITEGGTLNKINPDDIETVSVLKDAGSTAIYGSRSANGVILVTTKRGRQNQKPTVAVGTQWGVQQPNILFSPVAGYENATLRNLALTNSGMDPQFSPAAIADLYAHQDIEKWNLPEIMKNSFQQKYNISVTGGGEKSSYLFSGGFYNQPSNFVGQNFGIKRYNLRTNLSTEIGRFKLTSILAYTRNNNMSNTAGSAIINASRLPSYYYYRMQADNGKYLVNNALTDQNPLAELNEGGYIKHDNDYFNINLNLEAKLMDGLKLRGIFGADIYADHRFIRRIQVPLYANPDAAQPQVYVNSDRNTEDFNEKASLLNFQLLLDYDKNFGGHHVSGLFGASNESYTRRQNELKMKFTDPVLGTPTTGTIIDPVSARVTPNGTLQNSINSLFGRAGYDFESKYFAEFSFRYDGSSKFSKANRWGFFPSGSLGWRASDEHFMNWYKEHIGSLKVRSTYGVLGNQAVDDYSYYFTYESYPNSYGFNNKPVAAAGFNYASLDLRWEKTYNFNVGVDATFFNDKLTASFDYFKKRTVDILMSPQIPSTFGTTLKNQNLGEMNNEGWEINVSYRTSTGAFQHTVSANMGDSHNKIVAMPGDDRISTVDNITKLTRVGLPYNSYYGYKMAGLFQNIADIETSALPSGITAADLRPGDVKYVDRNNDGIIDARDRFVLGNGFPRFTFGLTYNLSYKDFDFSMFWQGVGKRDMMIRGELIEPFHQNYSYAIYQHQLDYWTPTNIDGRWPRLTANGSTASTNNFGKDSDLYLFNGKYARLKNLQIGYTLPKNVVSKWGLQRVRFFVNGQNLLTLSKNSWIDPESSEFDSNMGGSANSARNYPTLKYYGGGLNIQF
ncbi:TonB-dependent receptor [Sphingobacterium thalpophilum]|uniref:Outer membrane receptor for ferrienterochelin and colicins n=2 Tax=Sphingobacterium thalpophilum TaxID=259 RepID=A0A4U9VCP6_9SPHI|nr:TonB-dependent receptor [Sphingobacterium thalpophilum]VTR42862.1 Outer membrane receptor for ferrienterochelin and colicins [Sphingobacterium thalpophilum]